MIALLPQITTGRFDHPARPRAYLRERLGDMLVERVIWDQPVSETGWLGGATVCYRFWLLAHDHVVERYYTPEGRAVGIHIDVCSPLRCDDEGCVADDYLLDIHITATGEVTIHNEDAFETAVGTGRLTREAGAQVERHLRELTAAIARGRFPPPIVRNWQVDARRLRITD